MNYHLPRRYPVTIIISLLAVLIHFVPTLSESLQTDFVALSDGQWWRIWTGHLTHFDAGHLFWDLLMFIGLAGACEHRCPRQILPGILLMAAAITFAVRLLAPEVSSYRGLSGIDTGLFVWFAGMRLRQSLTDRDHVGMLLWLVPCVGLIGKLVYEAVSGQTLFVDSADFLPLVESHLAGVVIGLLILAASALADRRTEQGSGINSAKHPAGHLAVRC